MSLEEQIQADMKSALKSGHKFELNTLRSLLAQIKDERIRLRPERPLNDDDVLRVAQQAVKKRRESVELYIQGKRMDLAEKEQKEISILQKYLPEQLSEQEISKIVAEVIDQLGATSIRDLGKVMGPLMGRLKGKADGKLVQSIVRNMLSQISE